MGRAQKFRKTPEEIRKNFKHAFEALTLSMTAYDEGYKGEAGRIAGTIYNFVHDYGKSTVSLLTLINRKNILFCNTAHPLNPNNLLTEMPLVISRVSQQGSEYIPIGEVPPTGMQPEQLFSKWWETGVMRDNHRRVITRKNLVFSFRHGEGGGHVSSDLDPVIADLKRNNSMGWTFVVKGQEFRPEYGPEYATIRQIANELYHTLTRNFPDLGR